jgi:hypothetical protein
VRMPRCGPTGQLRRCEKGLLGAACLLLTLGALAPSSGAVHLGLHPCVDMRTHSLRVTEIQSNFGCRRTHSTLRRLLRRGLHGLPEQTTHTRKWDCAKVGGQYICTRDADGSLATPPYRIVFHARAR